MGATTVTKTEKLVGKRIRRREDPRLLTGTATYVDDLKLPGMLHAVILRSPYGAAKIKSINIEAALKLPGVAAVYTPKDFELNRIMSDVVRIVERANGQSNV